MTRLSLLQIADYLFRSRGLKLKSEDRDQVVDVCTGALRPHDLLIHGKQAHLDTELHHLPIGSLSVNRLRYGCDVTVTPVAPEEDNFLITLPLTGAARFRYGTEIASVQPGQGAIVSPYDTFRFDLNDTFDQVILRLRRTKVEAMCASLIGSDKAKPVNFNLTLQDMPDFWFKLLETVASLGITDSKQMHPRLFAPLEDLVIECLLLTQPNSFSADIDAATTQAPFSQIRRAMEYMRANIDQPLRMSNVARHCGVSLRSLQAGFRRDLGASPGQWLRAERLNHVYSALAVADPEKVTVTDVAIQWGFFHLSDFAAQFRIRFGERPSEVLGKLRR